MTTPTAAASAAAPAAPVPAVRPQAVRTADASSGLPRFTLQVAPDGCGVIRSGDPATGVRGLQWSVSDTGGFEVLGRNAEGETRYRFFQGGSFSVVLKAFDGQSYAAVSNAVSIRC